MTDDAGRAAKALIAALRLLADSLPGMHEQQVAPGVISLMSGAERMAAGYELTTRTTSPLMVYHPAAGQQAPPTRASAAASVVVAHRADQGEDGRSDVDLPLLHAGRLSARTALRR